MQAVWNNWLLVAVMAPALWALVNIVDAYFVKEVYKDEHDGIIISGLFNAIPWLVVPFVKVVFPSWEMSLVAIFGGYLYMLSMYFYFKAMFATGDAALIQVIWNLASLVVPILAFGIIGEKLSSLQYLGIIVTFIGAMALSLEKNSKENLFKILFPMFGAVMLVSISMVAEKVVYTRTEFLGGFLMFSLGSFLTGGTFLIVRTIQGKTGHLFKLNKNNALSFAGAELLALAGVICSQRAIDISPAVSFVAVIESLMPAFVIAQSLIIFVIFKAFSLNREDMARDIYNNQTKGWGVKLVAVSIMAIGIYLIKT